MTREEALERLRAVVAANGVIIGSGAGTGISAKLAEAGGVDLLVVYNSGRYRMAGRSSLAGLLPYGDANAIVLEMAGEVLPVVRHTPVLAGVCGTDPFRPMPQFLKQVIAAGFVGVQNFPSVGIFDGTYRDDLEDGDLGYGKEVEMIRIAHEMGLLTSPYAFTPDEAKAMAQAGADLVVAHMGLTAKGTVGARRAMSLDEAVARVQAIHDAARSVSPDILVICHGGPIAEPADASYVLQNTTGVSGFYGASSMERLPLERAMVDNMRRFKAIDRRKAMR